MILRLHLVVAVLALTAASALAQGTGIAFGGIKGDPTLPVEVNADSLSVSQADGTAVFTGNVLIAQGDMRLSAREVRVVYAKNDLTRIERLDASGGVTLVSGADAAEAQEAEYSVTEGVVTLRGSVLLTQGPNAMSGEVLVVDLTTGTGRMEGRVKTILNPGGN